jgi:exodeoxyribonuclease VII small subunit
MPKKSDSVPPSSAQLSEHWHYETSVSEIETIISRIESGELELEDVFEQFAQAVESLQQCETFLAERQAQVELLIETLGDPPSA